MSLRRHQLVGLALFVAAGCVVPVGLLRQLTRRDGKMTFVSQTKMLSLDAQLQTAIELRRASDVVVDLLDSGVLAVSGRAVSKPVRLSSIEELTAFLRSIPSPGIAVVQDRYTLPVLVGASGVPPEALTAERQVKAALELAGFHEPRGSVKTTFLPKQAP